jgi:hypothetical protein
MAELDFFLPLGLALSEADFPIAENPEKTK